MTVIESTRDVPEYGGRAARVIIRREGCETLSASWLPASRVIYTDRISVYRLNGEYATYTVPWYVVESGSHAKDLLEAAKAVYAFFSKKGRALI